MIREIEINTFGVPLKTGFTVWFKPQEDISPYEVSLLLILIGPKRIKEDLQDTFDRILEKAPLIIRHFEMKESK